MAKRKVTTTTCIFCSTRPGNTRDHQPPIGMFRDRWRPEGLEIPACLECNNGTRDIEAIAQVLALGGQNDGTPAGKQWRNLLRGAQTAFPGLIPEMLPSARQKRVARAEGILPASSVFTVSGPLVRDAVLLFGAKLGQALHYEVTGHTVPSTGGVHVLWYTNYSYAMGQVPPDLNRLFTEFKTLKQGKRSVPDQFSYSYAVAQEGTSALYLAHFGKAFTLLMAVGEHLSFFDRVDTGFIFLPGVHGAGPKAENFVIRRGARAAWKTTMVYEGALDRSYGTLAIRNRSDPLCSFVRYYETD